MTVPAYSRNSQRLLVWAALVAVAAVAAVALSACGGGRADAKSANVSGSTPTTSSAIVALGASHELTLAGGAPIKGMAEALLVGSVIVVRSLSEATLVVNGNPVHPRTRLSVFDQQGRLLSSTDYGFTLAPGYTGEWQMLPSPNGFMLLQSGPGTRLWHFDGQARLSGQVLDLYPAAASSGTEMAAAENSAALDGNGFWLATTFAPLPVTDKTRYQLKLAKFDFNGLPLTPPFTISTAALHPRVAATGGAVLAAWMEGGGAMLAMWPKGAGAPVLRSLATGGAQPYPVALDLDGKLGVLWGGKATLASGAGVMGVALDRTGLPVLASGRTDVTQESLSAQWAGTRRTVDIDARLFQGSLLLAEVIVGSLKPGDPSGDVLLLADYRVSSAPLSAQQPVTLRYQLADAKASLGSMPILKQLLIGSQALLLIGDEDHVLWQSFTRN